MFTAILYRDDETGVEYILAEGALLPRYKADWTLYVDEEYLKSKK